MRDVAKQALLRLHHRLETLGHPVEVSAELSDLVVSLRQVSGNASAKISFGQFVGGCSQIEDRFRQVASKRETKDAANQEYDEKTKPLINYYDERGILNQVDGSQSPDEVEESIHGILATLRREEEEGM